jgi:hypothetical protein
LLTWRGGGGGGGGGRKEKKEENLSGWDKKMARKRKEQTKVRRVLCFLSVVVLTTPNLQVFVDGEDNLRVGDVLVPPKYHKWILFPEGDESAPLFGLLFACVHVVVCFVIHHRCVWGLLVCVCVISLCLDCPVSASDVRW